jgi:hypothetical protein
MKQNRLAIWALATSLTVIPVGLVLAYGVGLLLSPIPIILGFVALRQIKASGERGRVTAIIGIAIGTVYLAIGLVLLAVALWLDVTDPLTIRE